MRIIESERKLRFILTIFAVVWIAVVFGSVVVFGEHLIGRNAPSVSQLFR